MLAVVCRQFGSPDLLRLEKSVAPQPGANEVLMSVRSANLTVHNVLIPREVKLSSSSAV